MRLILHDKKKYELLAIYFTMNGSHLHRQDQADDPFQFTSKFKKMLYWMAVNKNHRINAKSLHQQTISRFLEFKIRPNSTKPYKAILYDED
jgi:hypothetical protein